MRRPPFLRPTSRVRSAVRWTAVLAVALLTACAPAPPAERADILLLSIDTLRGDRWGCLGDPRTRTPWMDRIARRGTLAFEGRAPAPVTLPSHTSMLTGLPPASHGVRDNGIFRMPRDQGRLLAEPLAEAGWATAAFVSAYPLTKAFGLDRGFARYDSNLGDPDEDVGGMRQRPGSDTVDRAIRWLTGGRPDSPAADTPAFLWVHLFDPHAEYEPPDTWLAAHDGDPYRGEVAFVDEQAGRLLRRWKESRPGRELIIAVAADHGEGLNEHGESTHGALVHATTIRVPIVVASSAYEPRLLREPTALERIPATLLRRAGLPDRLNPGSAPALEDPPAPVHAETLYAFYNFGWAGLRVREADGWRLIDGPVPRLYHLADDPGETHDLAAEMPRRVAAMKEDLEKEWERREKVALAAEDREVTDEDLEALRALGYVGSGGSGESAADAFTRAADPHDRLAFVDRINQGLTLLGHGDAERAVAVLRGVVEQDPQNRFAYQYLGQAAMKAGRLGEARDAFRHSLSLGPNPDPVYRDLATVEAQLGNAAGETEVLLDAMVANPRSAETRNRLAGILKREGDLEEARDLLREAVELRPRFSRAWAALAQIEEETGRLDSARERWEMVIELEERGPLVRMARSRLEELEGAGS